MNEELINGIKTFHSNKSLRKGEIRFYDREDKPLISMYFPDGEAEVQLSIYYWGDFDNKVYKIKIGRGIKTLGWNFGKELENLREVDFSLAEDLEMITKGFIKNSEVKLIDLSPCTKLQFIGYESFWWCENLKMIILPNSIGNYDITNLKQYNPNVKVSIVTDYNSLNHSGSHTRCLLPTEEFLEREKEYREKKRELLKKFNKEWTKKTDEMREKM